MIAATSRFPALFAPLPPLLAALCLCFGCSSGDKHPKGLDALAEAFRAANQAEDIGPMLDLYHLEGTDETTRQMLAAALKFELGLPIAQIQFEPLSGAPEETIRFVHDGVPYGPTLEPRYRMRVVYEAEDRFTSLFTLGRRADGVWRIICAAPKPLPKP